jgi:energy-coupling factor transporter ATP-binding protein EcfA2
MKYRQLVSFEPIESVIQLEQADSLDAVRQLVKTFVISKRMAEQLTDLVIPNLQFGQPADNKGVLVVGNYGTGKSHLLSLISGLAEHADLTRLVRDKDVAAAAKAIAGKFKVVRLEIPATKKSLRNIICGRLEDFLAGEGLTFTFPADAQVDSNKDDLSRMMAQFNDKYPDHGLLLVVDELLDYLRSRKQHDLILDLGFLREMGEVCKLIRFRIIAGLQESLFDNPKFQFVAESLRRVKDRFEQLRIVRQDVAYVVSERLLTKNDEQKARIREHLQKFTPLYGGMAERLEEFVRLFHVHPTYLEVFEAISIAEKREVLKTLSAEIKRCLDADVPPDQPGLISYDSYWDFLQSNAVLRSVPEIRDVIDVSKVVENRIEQAYTRKALQPMALRVVHGLSIHRLTTDDIRAKIGPTAEELQNGLCLLAPIPEKTSDFLRTTVETCLREIMKTMSGQFITHNTENDQYYLDLQKTIDHDAKIQGKADTLSESQLDQYYFDALTRVLECADQTYVRGYQIWEHEIEWRDHKITRRGYLFFGAPNERSTAQPPRDFYLYFLQPFEPPHFEDQKLADEVFFKLAHTDKAFLDALKLYAGAREMAASASSGTKKVYEDKADGFLRTLVAWLRQNMLTSFEVTHQGVPKKMVEWLKGHRTGNAAVRDLVELTGSVCLAQAFEDRYPEYPTFTVKLTASNLKQPTEDVIRWLAGGVKNNLANAVLDGLELLDVDRLKPHQSRYAKAVLTKLEQKPPGQVVNRKELLTVKNDVERDGQYQLEPEFLAIVLLALVQNGNITLSLAGKKLDAANLSEAGKTPLEQLLAFKHIEKPKGLPLAELVALFDLLGLAEGLLRNPDTHEEAVKQLRSKANELTEKVVTVAQHVQAGLPCWGSELIPAEDRDRQRQNLDALKGFLEGLQAINTPGKLKNFTKGVAEVQAQAAHLDLVKEIEDLNGLVQELPAVQRAPHEAVAGSVQGDGLRPAAQAQLGAGPASPGLPQIHRRHEALHQEARRRRPEAALCGKSGAGACRPAPPGAADRRAFGRERSGGDDAPAPLLHAPQLPDALPDDRRRHRPPPAAAGQPDSVDLRASLFVPDHLPAGQAGQRADDRHPVRRVAAGRGQPAQEPGGEAPGLRPGVPGPSPVELRRLRVEFATCVRAGFEHRLHLHRPTLRRQPELRPTEHAVGGLAPAAHRRVVRGHRGPLHEP